MSEEAKWAFIVALDDELLTGSAAMSEWCAFIVRDCDYGFVGGAKLNTDKPLWFGTEPSYPRGEFGS